ncbi:MAG: hypothetical protein HKN84_10105 [Gammaproteobacteria bacterium]|nr:hypothetical protein [Gammaproteobacteria bacterium]
MTTIDRKRALAVARIGVVGALAMLYLAACASQQAGDPQSPSLALTPSPTWFECHARFDCVVVYDANVCIQRAVNTRHAVEFETWARAFLARAGESRDCAPDPGSEPRAVCRDSRCEIAESNLDALIEYTR